MNVNNALLVGYESKEIFYFFFNYVCKNVFVSRFSLCKSESTGPAGRGRFGEQRVREPGCTTAGSRRAGWKADLEEFANAFI